MFWNKFRKDYSDVGLLLFRVVVGTLFMLHGLQKFGVLSGGFAMPQSGLMVVAALVETFAGLLVLLGLFTEWAAFFASGTMAVAYWMSHAFGDKGVFFNPLSNGGELAVIYCFSFLLLFFLGAGKYSLDAKLKK